MLPSSGLAQTAARVCRNRSAEPETRAQSGRASVSARSREMCLGGVRRKGYICTLSPLDRASLARQQSGCPSTPGCTCCPKPRPRCLVILLPQGGPKKLLLTRRHAGPGGSSLLYGARLARGCRCNVSRLVTYSVSSAGMGSTRCVW